MVFNFILSEIEEVRSDGVDAQTIQGSGLHSLRRGSPTIVTLCEIQDLS